MQVNVHELRPDLTVGVHVGVVVDVDVVVDVLVDVDGFFICGLAASGY